MKRLFAVLLVVTLLFAGCKQNSPSEPAVQLPEVTCPVPQAQMVTHNEEGLANEEILSQRRDIVEEKMRHMMGMLWTPAEDITYAHNDYDFVLKKGRIYRGMPYSHGSGSGYSFLQYATSQDENGVYTVSMDGKMMTGEPNAACISNDCADALFWAWATVSTSISFPYTNKMSSYTGCLKVGDYYWPDMLRFDGSTKPIVQEQNGEEVMFAAYAQLQKGDGLVLYTKSSGGHALMVCESVVVMDGDKIDGEASYVRILEQESAGLNDELTYYDETIGKTVYVACGYDEIWTFNTIYKKGYLPITCKELVDPSPLTEQTITDTATEFSEKNMFSGRISSPYRLSSVTYTVYDQDNRAVQQSTYFVREDDMFHCDLYHFENVLDQEYMQGTLELDALPSGTYKCVLTCQTAPGSIFEVRSFDITR